MVAIIATCGIQLGRHIISTLRPCLQTAYFGQDKRTCFGVGQLVRTHRGNANPLPRGTQTTVSCAQAEDCSLLGQLQSPNWVKVCLVSTVFFLPVSIVPKVEKCHGLSVTGFCVCGARLPIFASLSAVLFPVSPIKAGAY